MQKHVFQYFGKTHSLPHSKHTTFISRHLNKHHNRWKMRTLLQRILFTVSVIIEMGVAPTQEPDPFDAKCYWCKITYSTRSVDGVHQENKFDQWYQSMEKDPNLPHLQEDTHLCRALRYKSGHQRVVDYDAEGRPIFATVQEIMQRMDEMYPEYRAAFAARQKQSDERMRKVREARKQLQRTPRLPRTHQCPCQLHSAAATAPEIVVTNQQPVSPPPPRMPESRSSISEKLAAAWRFIPRMSATKDGLHPAGASPADVCPHPKPSRPDEEDAAEEDGCCVCFESNELHHLTCGRNANGAPVYHSEVICTKCFKDIQEQEDICPICREDGPTVGPVLPPIARSLGAPHLPLPDVEARPLNPYLQSPDAAEPKRHEERQKREEERRKQEEEMQARWIQIQEEEKQARIRIQQEEEKQAVSRLIPRMSARSPDTGGHRGHSNGAGAQPDTVEGVPRHLDMLDGQVPMEQLIPKLFSGNKIDATKVMIAGKIRDYLGSDHPIDPLVDMWKVKDYPNRNLAELALQKLESVTFNAKPAYPSYKLFFRKEQELFGLVVEISGELDFASRAEVGEGISGLYEAEGVVKKSNIIDLRLTIEAVSGQDQDSKLLKISWDPKQFTLADVEPVIQ